MNSFYWSFRSGREPDSLSTYFCVRILKGCLYKIYFKMILFGKYYSILLCGRNLWFREVKIQLEWGKTI